MSNAELKALAELYQAKDNDMVIDKITKFQYQTELAIEDNLDPQDASETIGVIDDFVTRFIDALNRGEI